MNYRSLGAFGPTASALCAVRIREFHGYDSRPSAVRNFVAYSLKRLGVDYIDIYRPAGLDPGVPIEDTVGAIADLLKQGYVRHIGLSEVGAKTIRRALARAADQRATIVPLIGARRRDRLTESLGALGVELSNEHLAEIERAGPPDSAADEFIARRLKGALGLVDRTLGYHDNGEAGFRFRQERPCARRHHLFGGRKFEPRRAA